MSWTNDPEVALVKRRNRRDSEPLGDGNHGRVGGAKRKVGVRLNEIGDPAPIACGQRDDGEQAGLEGPQERGFNQPPPRGLCQR